MHEHHEHHEPDEPQQLTLLAPVDIPLQFRIDEATRRRGLRHIAEIRLQLATRHGDRRAA